MKSLKDYYEIYKPKRKVVGSFSVSSLNYVDKRLGKMGLNTSDIINIVVDSRNIYKYLVIYARVPEKKNDREKSI